MAFLYVTEYSEARLLVAGQLVQCPLEPPLVEQKIDFTNGLHNESAAFNANTTFVRIETDAVCSVLFGLAPVATTNSARLAANQTEYRGIRDGLSYKVSVIVNT